MCSSVARAPACRAGRRRFESGHMRGRLSLFKSRTSPSPPTGASGTTVQVSVCSVVPEQERGSGEGQARGCRTHPDQPGQWRFESSLAHGGASGDDTRLRTGTERPTSVTRVAALPMKDLRADEGHVPRAYGSGFHGKPWPEKQERCTGSTTHCFCCSAPRPRLFRETLGGVTREAWTQAW